jgi:hypothetical protein
MIVATVGVIAGLAFSREAKPKGRAGEKATGLPPVPARPLSMTVGGTSRMCDPLNLHFFVSDPAVNLLQIELANPLDKGAKTFPCVKTAPEVFVAAVEPKVVERWYNANGYWEGETKKLPVCLLFTLGGHAGCKTIWVEMCPGRLEDAGPPDDASYAWFVEGPCASPLPQSAPIFRRTGTDRR